MEYDFGIELEFVPGTESWGYVDAGGKIIPYFSYPYHPDLIDSRPKFEGLRRLIFKTSIGYRYLDFKCEKDDAVILTVIEENFILIQGSFGNRRYQSEMLNLSKLGKLRLKRR